MFDLKIANMELDGPTCAVSWCVDQETLKYLSDNNNTDPQVVIVVAPEGRHYSIYKEYRKVVPLKDLMTYVEIRCAGPNKIWGFISSQKKSSARDMYLSRRDGYFKTDILTYDGSNYLDDFLAEYANNRNKLTVSQPQPVVVPTDVFASEPWKWEQTWVNYFFREKCVDQCEFRRRRLFAYTAQVLVMAFNIMTRMFFVLVSLLIGARDFSLEPLLHPLMYSLKDAAEICGGGSLFVKHLPEDDKYSWEPNPLQLLWYLARKLYLFPFMPIVAIGVGLLTKLHWWSVFLAIGVVLAMILVACMIITFLISDGHKALWQWLNNVFTKQDESLWYLDQNEIDLLTCKADQKPLDFKSLPARKKTLHLRFQDLKSKVCKPYSG